jgi:hypothetical protein
MLADLPKAEQDSVRENNITDSITKARTAVSSLRAEMCQYTIVEDRGQVVIVKGRGQPKCGTPQVVPSAQQLAVRDLPRSRQEQVGKTMKTTGLADANRQFNELVKAAKACQSPLTTSPDCPQQTKKTP